MDLDRSEGVADRLPPSPAADNQSTTFVIRPFTTLLKMSPGGSSSKPTCSGSVASNYHVEQMQALSTMLAKQTSKPPLEASLSARACVVTVV